ESVDKSAHVVSVSKKGITIREALDAVLVGSGMRYRMVGEQLLVEPSSVLSAQDGIIAGRILHAKTKQPIVGATVTLEGTKQSVVTGNDGSFRVTVPPGEYTLSVRSVGMVRMTRKITVAS